jgi:SEC-C motif-containing protein
MSASSCPCGSGRTFAECCEPVLSGSPAPTAEALMRSRYTAFVVKKLDHLATTLAPEALEGYDPAEVETWAGDSEWLGLDIRATEAGGADDQAGTVEFVARYRMKGKAFAHHELSQFRRVEGQWKYVDGTLNPRQGPRTVAKVGRNDPCPCGSGKKHKKCCGA